MRSSIRIPILLLALSFSTFAQPYQRRSGGLIPESVAGSSEARLAETANQEAASPPPATSEARLTETAEKETAPPSPGTSASPGRELKDSAKPDADKTLPEELRNPPSGLNPALVKIIGRIWRSKGPRGSTEIQRWLDELSEQTQTAWDHERTQVDEITTDFVLGQDRRLAEFRKEQLGQIRADLGQYIKPKSTANYVDIADAYQQGQRTQEAGFIRRLDASKAVFLENQLKRLDQNDATRRENLAWIEKASRDYGSMPASDRGTRAPPAWRGRPLPTIPEEAASSP